MEVQQTKVFNGKEYMLQMKLSEKTENMLIHGFLLAIQSYVVEFGLEYTAAYVLKLSGINKEDLIRCQLENGFENEKMLDLINRAFQKSNS